MEDDGYEELARTITGDDMDDYEDELDGNKDGLTHCLLMKDFIAFGDATLRHIPRVGERIRLAEYYEDKEALYEVGSIVHVIPAIDIDGTLEPELVPATVELHLKRCA